MQIPRADWLKKGQGKAWVCTLVQLPVFKLKCKASAHLKIDLGAKHNAKMGRSEHQQLEIMATLGNEFGLDRQLIFDLANSIFRARVPYRADSQGCCRIDMARCP